MVFILSGTGEVHIGHTNYPLRKGDIVPFPPGGKSTAHQMINTGIEDLRYLAVSTKQSPESASIRILENLALWEKLQPKTTQNPPDLRTLVEKASPGIIGGRIEKN